MNYRIMNTLQNQAENLYPPDRPVTEADPNCRQDFKTRSRKRAMEDSISRLSELTLLLQTPRKSTNHHMQVQVRSVV